MKKILLIEDDQVMRENTAEILELANYQVFTAPNGKKGVPLAKETKPDIIICDIMMPELDGYGVLHMLSNDPVTAGIPFIFLTAKAEKSEMRRGMELGADDYLTKPFEEMELLNAIETRLKKKDTLNREFSRNVQGINQFLDETKGLHDLENLSRNLPLTHYKKKEVLFHEGDAPRHLFFLNDGKVKTTLAHDDGKEYVSEIYKQGDFIGYIPILKNAPYTDTAVILEDAEICKIPKEDFLSLLYKNRDVAARFMRLLSNNVAEREKQLLSLAYDTVRKRIAEALVTLDRRYADPGKKETTIPITRDDLAGMVGTAVETLIRGLGDFKAEKLIEVDGRKIVILNIEGLKSVMY